MTRGPERIMELPSVVVKYVEIGKNTSGEGGYMMDGF